MHPKFFNNSLNLLLQHISLGALTVLRVIYDDAQDAHIDEKEYNAGQPESRDIGRVTVEFELEALLQPCSLAENPKCESGDANAWRSEECGDRQIVGEKHHVPKEVLQRT